MNPHTFFVLFNDFVYRKKNDFKALYFVSLLLYVHTLNADGICHTELEFSHKMSINNTSAYIFYLVIKVECFVCVLNKVKETF